MKGKNSSKNLPVESNLLSMGEAAKISRITRQGIYVSIRKGRLKARKAGSRWVIKKEDLEEYRASKHRRDLKEIDGVKVFDLDAGYYSVPIVCRLMAEALKQRYSPQRLYYLLQIGELPGEKKGGQWVIRKEDAKNLLAREMGEDSNQMKFA